MTLTRVLTSFLLIATLTSCGGSRDISGAREVLPTIGSSGGANSNVLAMRLFGAKSGPSSQTPAG